MEVEEGNCLDDTPHHHTCILFTETAPICNLVEQLPTSHQLHHDVQLVFLLENVVRTNNARVKYCTGNSRLNCNKLQLFRNFFYNFDCVLRPCGSPSREINSSKRTFSKHPVKFIEVLRVAINCGAQLWNDLVKKHLRIVRNESLVTISQRNDQYFSTSALLSLKSVGVGSEIRNPQSRMILFLSHRVIGSTLEPVNNGS
mmetsp:Transcript_4665/g.6451  ORF Transcript_4665/g.6451 Transcript_4665/m.6451 type:complete len:200 (-) Transcript_4665:315-914(-)